MFFDNRFLTLSLLVRKSYLKKPATTQLAITAFQVSATFSVLTSTEFDLVVNVGLLSLSWWFLLNLTNVNDRAIALERSTLFWPPRLAVRLLGTFLAIPLPVLLFFFLYILFGSVSLSSMLATILLYFIFCTISCIHESLISRRLNSIQLLIRNGGVCFILPIIVSAAFLPVSDLVDPATAIFSAVIISIIGSGFSFVASLSTFLPGFYVPGYLSKSQYRFCLRLCTHAAFGVFCSYFISGFSIISCFISSFVILSLSSLLHYFICRHRGRKLWSLLLLSVLYAAILDGLSKAAVTESFTRTTLVLLVSLLSTLVFALTLGNIRRESDEVIASRLLK